MKTKKKKKKKTLPPTRMDFQISDDENQIFFFLALKTIKDTHQLHTIMPTHLPPQIGSNLCDMPAKMWKSFPTHLLDILEFSSTPSNRMYTRCPNSKIQDSRLHVSTIRVRLY